LYCCMSTICTVCFHVICVRCFVLLLQEGKVTYAQCLASYEKFEGAIHVVQKNFEGAMDGATLHQAAVAELVKHGINGDNTLFAQSICPDEINHECGDVTNLFQEHLGEVFHMGGLAGLPFTGKTGFTAFGTHVPDGKCFCARCSFLTVDVLIACFFSFSMLRWQPVYSYWLPHRN
jgi:hypothetical protein